MIDRQISTPLVIEPVTLESQYVRLEPLSLDHVPQLAEVGLDPDIWRWITALIRTPDDMRDYVEGALHLRDTGTVLPFATIDKVSGRVVGSTRLGNIDKHHHRVEIGWTWIGREWQRTAVNTEAKYLLLCHAFDTLGCIRVELKTDVLNERSRVAIQRIGAKQEGIFRHHMVMPGGRLRDSVYFAIIDSEWPDVKANLELKMKSYPQA